MIPLDDILNAKSPDEYARLVDAYFSRGLQYNSPEYDYDKDFDDLFGEEYQNSIDCLVDTCINFIDDICMLQEECMETFFCNDCNGNCNHCKTSSKIIEVKQKLSLTEKEIELKQNRQAR